MARMPVTASCRARSRCTVCLGRPPSRRTASSRVFGRLFFPTFSELAGTLAAFASFAVGFVARPVGGLLFGHIGDRVGRKTTLVVTLTMMGLDTFAMGLMPPYSVIGVWAPVLMVALRFIQGVAVGG